KVFWRTADFVHRNEAVVDITNCVLKPLRHHWSGELLELEGEIQLSAVHHLIEAAAFELQRVTEEIEDAARHSGIQSLGSSDCELDMFLVARRVLATFVDIGPVHGEASDGLADAVAQSLQCEVARTPIA